jgi:hypothetical protein
VNLNGYDLISGIVQVNDLFQSSGLLVLFINRFVLNGCLRQDLAQLRTLRSAEAFTSPCLSPTSFYCSSWSLACCAFAGVGVPFIFRASFGNRWSIDSSCWRCCLTAFDVLQGVIWLAIATAAEVPLVVSTASFIIVHKVFPYLSPFAP